MTNTRCVTAGRFTAPAIVLVLGGAACNRYEQRRIVCPPGAPTAASSIAWQLAPDAPGTLTLESRTVNNARIRAAMNPQARLDTLAWRVIAADGTLRFDSVSPGPHDLTVRALGHRVARTKVVVPPGAGVLALAAMAADPISINEVCGMTLTVPKPWWKFW
jgi:hypothetical protein